MILNIFIVISTTFIVLYLLSVIGYPFYIKWGIFKKFYHDIMLWHRPDDGPETFDGCSFHAKCKHCGKDIMQDSQGNWF